MLEIINSVTPFAIAILCLVALIWTRFRTLELDSTLLLYVKILIAVSLINADMVDNDFVPVPSTVFARILVLFSTALIVKVVRRAKIEHDEFIRMSAVEVKLRQRISKLEQEIKQHAAN